MFLPRGSEIEVVFRFETDTPAMAITTQVVNYVPKQSYLELCCGNETKKELFVKLMDPTSRTNTKRSYGSCRENDVPSYILLEWLGNRYVLRSENKNLDLQFLMDDYRELTIQESIGYQNGTKQSIERIFVDYEPNLIFNQEAKKLLNSNV